MSILNKTVSYFPGITATTQGVDVNLLALLKSNKHKEAMLYLRQADEAKQKTLKEKLPCYTVAGTFSRRCDDGLIQPSGLAAVDLDSAENYDAIYLLNELKQIDCIAYAGLSCRGKRLFCIVPFKYPDKYVKHYERLIKSFNDLGLPMGDDCHKRISQPRFVSWNDESTQFFNHNAKPYDLLPTEKIYIPKYYRNSNIGKYTNQGRVEVCINKIQQSRIDITGNYEQWFSIGCSLANEFGEIGRNYYHSVSQYYSGYTQKETEKQFSDCLKHSYRYTIATFFEYCKLYRIEFKEVQELVQPIAMKKVAILEKKPNNNPFIPTDINNKELTIIEHYSSYRMPYKVDIESELNSVVSGLLNETNIRVEPNIYRDIVNKYSLS